MPHLGVAGEDEKRNFVAEGVMKDSSEGAFVGGHGTEADWGEARHWVKNTEKRFLRLTR